MKTIETNETLVTPSAPYRTRLIVLLSVFIALCLLAGTLAIFTFVDFSDSTSTGGSSGGTNGNGEGFIYRDTAIGDYITLTESMIKGLTVAGGDSRIEDVTDEDIKKSINLALLSAVATTETNKDAGNFVPKKTVAATYADELYLYILYVTNEDGERVLPNFFNTAYMEVAFLQIGMESFGPEFDEKLIGLVPKDTGSFEVRTMGSVSADDVICLTYTVTETILAAEEGGEETAKTHKTISAERMELALADEAWRTLLLENYGAIGQKFSFEYEEDADKDGDKEKVTYEGVITAVIEDETYYQITAKLPDDYFGKNPKDEERAALNGATLTFHINIDYLVEHDANTVDNMTVVDMTQTLGVTPTNLADINKETNPDGYEEAYRKAREECVSKLKKLQQENNDAAKETLTLSLIWGHLLDNLNFTGTLPAEAIEEIRKSAREELEYYYSYNSSDPLFLETFPNRDLFAASSYMWSYDVTEYDGYEDYIDNYYSIRAVKQMLLTFGIYETFIDDEKKLSTYYEELISELIAANTQGDSVPTRADVIEYFGEDYLRDTAIAELVNDYLVENNTVDWNLYKNTDK